MKWKGNKKDIAAMMIFSFKTSDPSPPLPIREGDLDHIHVESTEK